MTQWFSRSAGFALQIALVAGLVSCTGSLNGEPQLDENGNPIGRPSDPNTPVAPGSPGSGTGEDWRPASLDDEPPLSPTLRLTQSQYQRSIVQAFGLEVMLPELPADETATLQHHPEAAPLGDYESYVGAATELGKQIAAVLLTRCDFADNTLGCTESQILPALRTLYRSDVGSAEAMLVSSTISEAAARSGDTTHGVSFGIARALIDPAFLYRLESGSGQVGADGGLELTPFETATRLSFFSSNQPPSTQLFDLTASGGLNDEATFKSEVDAAFTGDQLRQTVWTFMQKMLGLSTRAAEEGSLEQAMTEETRRFVEYILVDEQAPLSDLFNARYSFLNAKLAEHYGLPAPEQEWVRVDFPESSRRQGILTHGSFLSAHGREEPDRSWIFRGKAVYENLFCGHLPPPPPGVVDVEPKGSRLEDPSCSGCHSVMDPAGQFFDNFDRHGALRTDLATPGTFRAGSDIDLPFEDLPDFLNALADSRAFRHCFVMHWFSEALGRSVTSTDQASFDSVLSTFENTGSLSAMLKELSVTPAFLTVYPKPADQICQ